MTELYRSAHQVVGYYPEYSLIKRVLIGFSGKINWSIFQSECLEYAHIIRTLRPRNILTDARDFDILLPKEMQDWINENVVMAYNETGLQKCAIILPPQFLYQLSIEQTLEANPDNTFEIQYFENEADAAGWLQIGQLV